MLDMTKEVKGHHYFTNEQWLERAIFACDSVLKSYHNGTHGDSRKCDFCRMDRLYLDMCSACPWVVLNDVGCGGYSTQSVPERIKRIEKWQQACTIQLEKIWEDKKK